MNKSNQLPLTTGPLGELRVKVTENAEADLSALTCLAPLLSDGLPSSTSSERSILRVVAKRLASTMRSDQLGRLSRAIAEAQVLKRANSGIRPHTPEDLMAALEYFRARQDELEERHFGVYVTIDVDDGRQTIGQTATDAVTEFKKLHGERHTYTFHIGSTR